MNAHTPAVDLAVNALKGNHAAVLADLPALLTTEAAQFTTLCELAFGVGNLANARYGLSNRQGWIWDEMPPPSPDPNDANAVSYFEALRIGNTAANRDAIATGAFVDLAIRHGEIYVTLIALKLCWFTHELGHWVECDCLEQWNDACNAFIAERAW